MALTPHSDEAFLREVDDELRRDQAITFWRRYGMWLVAGLIAALVLFAGWLYWQHHAREVAAREAEQYQAVYDDLAARRFDAAAKPLGELTSSGSGGYRVLAVFTQADLLLQKDDLKGAAAKFGSVASDATVARPFRDLALIRQTTAEFDGLKPAVVIARLRGLATPGNPWLGSAGELVAAAYLKQGRRDLAGRMFASVARDEGVPASLRQRAVQMAGVLGVDAVGELQDKNNS